MSNEAPQAWAVEEAELTYIQLAVRIENTATRAMNIDIIARALQATRAAALEEAATFVDGFELMVGHGIGNRRLSLDRMVEKIRALKTQEVTK